MRIAIETPGQEAYETLNERLVDFNRTKVNWGTAAFTVVLRDEIGSARGGAHGVVRMGAVEIRSVWLDGDLRGRGFGAKIIRAVEDEARRLGARAALLDARSHILMVSAASIFHGRYRLSWPWTSPIPPSFSTSTAPSSTRRPTSCPPPTMPWDWSGWNR
ncbi:MAG: GNAT family N-acetyltransferase [Alphaproteobacteria bacterium]|nr:MAG: GNAT family N-acetyltransferase [Alphaproteobacteria bacterium]